MKRTPPPKPLSVEEDVRKKIAQGFKVIRCQVAIPGNVGTYGAGGAKEAATATWGDGGAMPYVETWEPGPYLRTIPGIHPCDGFFAAILERI